MRIANNVKYDGPISLDGLEQFGDLYYLDIYTDVEDLSPLSG